MLNTFAGRWIATVLFVAVPALSQNLETGVEHYRSQRYQQAEKELRAVTAKNPDNADAHYYLGLTLLELKRAGEAQGELDKARERSLRADRQKVAEARLLMEQKNMAQAITALNEAEELSPENPEVYLYRGLSHANQQNFEAAVKDFEKVIELAPADARAHYYAGMSYNRVGRPDKMVEHFKIFLKLAPNSPDANKVQSLLRTAR